MQIRIFKKLAAEKFSAANPTATIVKDIRPARRVTYPTGLVGLMWQFQAYAPGHRLSTMTATYADATGWMIR